MNPNTPTVPEEKPGNKPLVILPEKETVEIFRDRITQIFEPEGNLPGVSPFQIQVVRFKGKVPIAERFDVLEQVHFNIGKIPADRVPGTDLFSDSGTSGQTDRQTAALALGDEFYAGNKGYFLLKKEINEIFGDKFFVNEGSRHNAFLFHQGRAAEDALFSALGTLGSDLLIPSNGHFDTTEANIHSAGIHPVNLFSQEDALSTSFRGNIDITKLNELLEKSHANIPVIFLTITNNTFGGQPVSLENIREVSELARRYEIPLMFDACRFAENAWFIKQHEYKNISIEDIIRKMFLYADGFTMSFKKDGLANMGGGLFFKDGGLFTDKYGRLLDGIFNKQILKEGHYTYGGMTGRDILTITEGLKVVTTQEYLDQRIGQVHRFGALMKSLGLPVVEPFGGHAIYLDMTRFFEDTDMKPEDFGGISFVALLYALYGHRVCELGNFAFGRIDEKGQHVFNGVNNVRFAIPRLKYMDADLVAVAHAVKALYDNRHNIPKAKMIIGDPRDPLRHFKAGFELI